MTRIRAGAALLVIFLWQVLVAGGTTAWWIVRPGRRPQPAFVWLPYSGIAPTGVVLLACLVTLTPGTTAVDIDLDARRLRLHLLDAAHAEAAIAGIRRRFERRLQALFPAGGER